VTDTLAIRPPRVANSRKRRPLRTTKITTKTQETRTRLFVVTVALALGLFGKAFGQLSTGPQQFLQSDPLATDGPSGSGTGFFVDPSGFLVTCAHVVSGTGEIKVIISSGEILWAKIYRIDIPHDLALLKVEREAPAMVPFPAMLNHRSVIAS
jgi:S1-C subfamily serine protease